MLKAKQNTGLNCNVQITDMPPTQIYVALRALSGKPTYIHYIPVLASP
jgi:hypothetical protein